jgi:AcrR family transcriptional regulator
MPPPITIAFMSLSSFDNERLLRYIMSARYARMGSMTNPGPSSHPQKAAHDPTVPDIVNDWWSGSRYSPVARQLLAAAIELFAEQGYHAAKTRDITARIGMSTGAMYAHFRSKEDLLFEISLTGHRTGVATLEAAAADGTDPADQLARMVRAFSVYHARYHMIAKIVHYELNGMTPQHLKQIVELRRYTARLIEDVIRQGIESDAFTAPNVTATGRAVLSLCVDVARWYREDSGETPEEIGDLNAQLALRMLGAFLRPARVTGLRSVADPPPNDPLTG